MKLKYEEIKERVDQVETDKASFVTMADEMEKLFKLEIYKESAEERLANKGQEQVLLTDPYNTIRLGVRLMADKPKIDVPALTGEMGKDERSEKIERWLLATHDRQNQIQDRSVIVDATWQTMTMGRGCYMVQWVENLLPKHVRSAQMPFVWRTPDPRNVGLYTNSLYTEYGYRKYVEPLGAVCNRYPHLRKKIGDYSGSFQQTTRLVTMIDFYYRSNKDGKIWHAITADDEFAKYPVATDYPDIPIIQFMGDDAPVGDEKFKGLGLLYPIKDLWKYNVRFANTLATGFLMHAWPMITWQGPGGLMPPDLEVGPGKVVSIPQGGALDIKEVKINQQLAGQIGEMLKTQLDQSTFPAVLYGDAPGSMQAGYGVNILADQARGRIANFKRNHEIALQKLHALTLAMVEEFGSDDGVAVYGMQESSGSPFRISLKPSDIKGNYENLVSLQPRIPQDDMQRESTGLQKVSANIVSRKTFREKINGETLPPDEENRIAYEMAMQNPAVMDRLSAQAIVKAHPDDWMDLLAGTPLEQGLTLKQLEKINKARESGKIAPLPPPPPPQGMMPPGGGMPPMGAPMPPDGGMMPPPGAMPPQAPPAPPQGDPVAMVGEMAMQMLQQGMPPEQVMAALGGQGVPPDLIQMVMQQLMGGGGDMQNPAIAPGAIPPQMSGQITPQMLGMSPEQVQAGMFQQVVRGASPDDLDARLGLPRG